MMLTNKLESRVRITIAMTTKKEIRSGSMSFEVLCQVGRHDIQIGSSLDGPRKGHVIL